MSDFLSTPCTAFDGSHRIASGPLVEVALAVKAAEGSATGPILIFDDHTGAQIDLDLRGSTAEIVARLTERSPRTPGRPKLGVVAREVTLLPRHWEWLAQQPGGASAALRRLVDEARRNDGGRSERRAAQEAAYRFLSAIAGNLPGFEEASRALFADDRDRFRAHGADWPADVRDHAERLGWGTDPAWQAENGEPE